MEERGEQQRGGLEMMQEAGSSVGANSSISSRNGNMPPSDAVELSSHAHLTGRSGITCGKRCVSTTFVLYVMFPLILRLPAWTPQ
jgi:hypothetical protein